MAKTSSSRSGKSSPKPGKSSSSKLPAAMTSKADRMEVMMGGKGKRKSGKKC